MTTGSKVKVLQGYGYTDITDGISRFRRANDNTVGTVTAIAPRQQVYITLENGHKIITDRNCIFTIAK